MTMTKAVLPGWVMRAEQTIEERILMLTAGSPDSWFNEVDFHDVCEDLITSKKDNYKSIKNAENKLLDSRDLISRKSELGEIYFKSNKERIDWDFKRYSEMRAHAKGIFELAFGPISEEDFEKKDRFNDFFFEIYFTLQKRWKGK
ncbi:MAG: hypothetical protein M1129_04250 [Candidatus Thermoplasmatota archaeon]|nr:hypothetical protein [Candidatus Thermoplasmatota archaeon]